MPSYDPKFIEEYANRLYAQSKTVVTSHFFIGIFIGIILFGSISVQLTGILDFLILAIGVLIGGVMGYGSGQSKALDLKLQAQVALCQVAIEKGLRQ